MVNKGLFVLHEGVGSTIFTSQVMEHAACMRQQGLTLDVLTFETFKRERPASQRNLARIAQNYPGVEIALRFGMNIYLPLSSLVNAVLLLRHLLARRGQYAFLHARADYTAFLCLLTKPLHGVPVVWDCRGDAVGELRDALSRRSRLLRATLGTILTLRQRLIGAWCRRFADGAIFVSAALREQHGAGLRTENVVVVPCPVPESKFFFDPALRARARQARGIGADQHVFIYSGSMVAYQGLAEQLALYRALLAAPQNVIVFATPEPDAARAYFHALPAERFQIVSVGYEQMNEIYNLADFGFMLREPKHLNWVASPTKFGEYCLAGLPVILNGTVEQASSNATALGNHVALADVLTAQPASEARRREVALAARQLYARDASGPTYRALYGACNGTLTPVTQA